jgi:hypothetical protein
MDPAMLLDRVAEEFEERPPVAVAIDRTTFVASARDLPDGSGMLQSKWSRHGARGARNETEGASEV